MKKHLLTIASLFVSGLAFAEVRTPISTLERLSWDGKSLDVVYAIGGGCQEHKPTVKVTVNGNNATVAIEDVSPAYDGCEAYLHLKGHFNIVDEIKKSLAAEGKPVPQPIYMNVELPKIHVQDY